MRTLKTFFIGIYFFFIDLPYLLMTDYTIKRKAYIIYIYIKSLFFNVLFGLDYISIDGLKIKSFNGLTVFSLFMEIFYRNEYFSLYQKDPKLIIDCGANTGMTSIFFAHRYPNAKIISFEPNAKAFSIFTENITNNSLNNIEAFNIALSDQDGEIDFFDTDEPSFSTGTLENRSGQYKKTKVKSEILSKLINNHVDILKIDIEGSEDNVIFDLDKKGTFPLISEIILEYHHNINGQESNLPEILSIFKKWGFFYAINTTNYRVFETNKFQDIIIHAKK
ncbi:MAG TPA: FkbM family methyltransferase [Candidatus Absconditabacterales bacterium]|nr:FkbM family methyltransferase [Candidatus Absconditabacterales bacterium]